MKKTLTLLAIFCSNSVFADLDIPTKAELIGLLDKQYEIKKVDNQCETLSGLNEVSMEARQSNLDIDEEYKSIERSNLPVEMTIKQKESLAQIYDYPIYPDKSEKKLVAKKIELKTFLECREKGLGAEWNLK